jgi:hypothetical protein
VFHSAIVIKCGSTQHVLDEGHSVGAARHGTFDQQAIKALLSVLGNLIRSGIGGRQPGNRRMAHVVAPTDFGQRFSSFASG